MEIQKDKITVQGIRFSINDNGKEIARARLYFIRNDLHAEPYAYIEDVFVDPNYRKRGLATQLEEEMIREAQAQGCYKIIQTSRFADEENEKENVHRIYERCGFVKWGFEFRKDLLNPPAGGGGEK